MYRSFELEGIGPYWAGINRLAPQRQRIARGEALGRREPQGSARWQPQQQSGAVRRFAVVGYVHR